MLERISPGNIIAMLILLGGLAVAWGSLQTRMSTVENNALTDRAMLLQMKEDSATFRQQMLEINRRVAHLECPHCGGN